MGREPGHRPSFSKLMVGDFRHELKIPQTFIKHLDGILPKIFLLKVSMRYWGVKLKKVKNDWFFGDGWKDFVEDNSIDPRDLLIFRSVNAAILHVSTFCKKEKVVKKRDVPLGMEEDVTLKILGTEEVGDSKRSEKLEYQVNHEEEVEGRVAENVNNQYKTKKEGKLFGESVNEQTSEIDSSSVHQRCRTAETDGHGYSFEAEGSGKHVTQRKAHSAADKKFSGTRGCKNSKGRVISEMYNNTIAAEAGMRSIEYKKNEVEESNSEDEWETYKSTFEAPDEVVEETSDEEDVDDEEVSNAEDDDDDSEDMSNEF